MRACLALIVDFCRDVVQHCRAIARAADPARCGEWYSRADEEGNVQIVRWYR